MSLQPYAPLGAMAVANSAGVPDVYVPNFAEDEQEEAAELIARLGPATIKRVALGLYHTLVVGLKGDQPQLFAWGKNYSNVLGLGVDVHERVYPGVVPFFSKQAIFAVSCGTNHSAVLVKRATQSGGKVYTFGLGNRGRLGYTKKGSGKKEGDPSRVGREDEDDGEEDPSGMIMTYGGRPGDPLEKKKKKKTATRQGGGGRGGDDLAEEDHGDSEPSWFTPKPSRVRFKDKCKIARISCGSDHTLALTDRGSLYAWGVGMYGNLGQGDTLDAYKPVKVFFDILGRRDLGLEGAGKTSGSDRRRKKNRGRDGGSEELIVLDCAAGAKHSMACTSDGALWTWGYGGNGRLGLGHNRGSLVPSIVDHLQDRDIVFVAAGDSHSACIDRHGHLYTWGGGGFGRLGHGDEGEIPVPRKVEGLGAVPILQVACGTFHTLALTHKGEVYAWGAGLALGLGEGEGAGGGTTGGTGIMVTVPRHLNDIEPAVLNIAAGPYHSAAVTVGGDLLVWGVGGSCRLGHGDQQNQPYPKFVADLRNRMYVSDLQSMLGIRRVQRDYSNERLDYLDDQGGGGLSAQNASAWTLQAIACGDSHTAALTGSGAVWIWGSNEEGQLGLGEEVEEDQYEPVQLDCFNTPIRRIACGGSHCLAVAQYGDVFAWGANDNGQLGLGVLRPSFTPAAVTGVRQAIEVFCGEDYSACITRSGAASTPLHGAGGGGASSIANAGSEFGDMWVWGSADSGKLGLGEDVTAGAVLSPQKVDLPTPVCTCALGKSHVVVISAQGDCYSWGAGYYGRLGIGNTANAYVPTKCDFPRGVKLRSVVAGAFHSMAISMDGDLWIWGRKNETCSAQNYTSPKIFMQLESASGVPKVKSIAACEGHSLAVTEEGRVFAWGDNQMFQTGCGKKGAEHFDRPEMVMNLPKPCQWVATGPQASFFVLESGEVYSAGASKGGRLGCGWTRKTYVYTPAAVVTHWANLGDITFDNAGGMQGQAAMAGG
ncbi:regulator of chromosome condensation repeat-containing protein, partial [Cystoisospora suis]